MRLVTAVVDFGINANARDYTRSRGPLGWYKGPIFVEAEGKGWVIKVSRDLNAAFDAARVIAPRRVRTCS